MKRKVFHKGIPSLVVLALLMLMLPNCQTPADPQYTKDGTPYGVVKGLFRERWWNFYERGVSYFDGGFWEEAIADFKEAIRQRDEDQRRARTDQIYRPFHATVSDVVNARRQAGVTPVLVTIHSFTPTFKGKVRLLDLGVLHDNDARLADAMLEVAQHGTGYSARRNDPYGPEDGVTHTLNLHRGNDELLNVMLEVRNDLIADEPGQNEWAGRLAVLLKQALRSIDNHTADQVLASSS